MDRTESLSEKQKLCLRLVGQGLSSKEIAPIAQTTYGVVDNTIAAACLKLGVKNRREAARILIAEESNGVQQMHVQPPALVPPSCIEEEFGQAEQRPTAFTSLRKVIEALFSLPPIGGQANDLVASERAIGMARIGFASALLLIATIVIVQGVVHLLT